MKVDELVQVSMGMCPSMDSKGVKVPEEMRTVSKSFVLMKGPMMMMMMMYVAANNLDVESEVAVILMLKRRR